MYKKVYIILDTESGELFETTHPESFSDGYDVIDSNVEILDVKLEDF